MGSRGESLMAPQVRQTRLSSGPSSTTPKPVYSVPQSTPRTRMGESLSQFQPFTVGILDVDGGRASSPVSRKLWRRRSVWGRVSDPSGRAQLGNALTVGSQRTKPSRALLGLDGSADPSPITFRGTPVLVQLSAAPGAACFCDFMFLAKGGVGGAGRCQLPLIQEARVGGLVENFAQRGDKSSREKFQAFLESAE